MTAAQPARAAYSPEAAADLYDTSRDTILRQIKAGKLAAKKLGTKYSITAQALEAWHNSLPEA